MSLAVEGGAGGIEPAFPQRVFEGGARNLDDTAQRVGAAGQHDRLLVIVGGAREQNAGFERRHE